MENLEKIVLAVVIPLALMGFFVPTWAMLHIEEQERKKRGEIPRNKALFDERQWTTRLQASQFALLSLGGFLVLWVALHLVGWFSWTNAIVELILGGLMLAATVWQIYCILNDAAIGWNQKPEFARTQKILFICYGVMFAVNAERMEGMWVALFLFVAFCMFAMAAAAFYADYRRKKREKCNVEEE